MKTFFRAFWRAMKHEKRVLILKAITSLLLSAVWIAEPLYAQWAINLMSTALDGAKVPFLNIIMGWFGLYVLSSIISGISMYYVWDVRNTVIARAREMYFTALLKLDIDHHIKARSGELMKKIDNAADTIADLTQQMFIQLPTSSITAIAFFGISLYISWQLTLAALLTIPLFLLIIIVSNRITKKNAEIVNRLWVNALGRGYDAISNIFTVKSSGMEEKELNDLQNKHSTGLTTLCLINFVWALVEGVQFFGLVRIVLTAVGFYLYTQDYITLGAVFFYQFGFFRMVVPFEMLGQMSPRWNEMMNKVAMAEDLFTKEIIVQNLPNAIIPAKLDGKILFDHVSLQYDVSDAISDITMYIEPGQHIALVGHSGAGKSSIALLLNRFYDPSQGTIFVDDIPLQNLDVHWWRKQIGLVQQENIMFNDTIAHNIAYSRPDALEEEIIEAAKRASAHDFIMSFPQGYQTQIGERGIRLSGGERQRIAIARAILKQPTFVILDEATSALDSITEKHVQIGIHELIAGRTAIIIAHRLSTVRSVDKIAVIDKGKLIAFDNHTTLLKTCAVYKEMVELQNSGLLMES
jgi:ATP-binding cassette, subfamily B, bacterial MsbA